MKNLNFILLILFSLQSYAQKEMNNNAAVDIVIDGSRKIGYDCSYTLGKFCEKSIKMLRESDVKNDSTGYGKIFIDTMDTLKLSIEKNTLSLEDILNLFQDNKYSLENDFHLSPEILYNLDIDPDYVIPKGDYPVSDSNNNNEIIITFLPVIYHQKNFQEKSNEEEVKKNNKNTNQK